MSLHIRPAEPADMASVRTLLRETWHATYDEIFGVAEVTRMTGEWHTERAMLGRLERPDSAFLVVEEGAPPRLAAMAFAALDGEGAIALHQLYVLPAHQRVGIGSLLLADVRRRLGEDRRIAIEVEGANAPAVSFYRARGFAPLGVKADGELSGTLRMELV